MAGVKSDGSGSGSGLVLLDVFGSPYAQRVRIALAEKGLAYERVEQDLAAKSDLLRRSNPVHGKVPVLLHDGRPVCESLAILQYLDEAFPGAPPLLLPPASDPYARARARFWAEYADRLHLCGKRLWLSEAPPGADGVEAGHGARAEMAAVMRALESELGGEEFFGGAAFGFVDAAAAPFAAWFLTYERHGGPSVAEECPALAAWAARCARRESVAANVYPPEKVYELVQEYRQWVLARK
jgi:glutathione S-transferase